MIRNEGCQANLLGSDMEIVEIDMVGTDVDMIFIQVIRYVDPADLLAITGTSVPKICEAGET